VTARKVGIVARFTRTEVNEQFERMWAIGSVGERWTEWSRLFTEDVLYHDLFWGPLHGRDEVDTWINAVMKGVPDIYTVYDWHTVDDDVVVFHYQNRRDNPDPAGDGPEYWDFPGLSVLWYAGDGLWRGEEDYWDRDGARTTSLAFSAARERAGITDPLDTMTRGYWGRGPAWARTDAPPEPSWLGRPELPPVVRPSDLYRLLGRDREPVSA
jgi:hypothetical protein